jgi:hypothetical protein
MSDVGLRHAIWVFLANSHSCFSRSTLLGPGFYTLGTVPACDVLLRTVSTEPPFPHSHSILAREGSLGTVSPWHCALLVGKEVTLVRDLGSVHGTYVGGEPCGDEAVELPPVCKLHVGDVRLDITPATGIAAERAPARVPFEHDAAEPVDAVLRAAGYRVEEVVSERLYRASHPAHGLVALKIKPEKCARFGDTSLMKAFSNARLKAPGMIATQQVLHANGHTVIEVAPWYRHGSVADRMMAHGGALPLDEAVGFGLQALSALAALHRMHGATVGRRGIHGNLKPSNLLLADRGAHIALELAHPRDMRTAPREVGFRPESSWSFVRAGVPVSEPAADVWSMAAVIYHMLTGGYVEARSERQSACVVPVRARAPGVPNAVADVVDAVLKAAPNDTLLTAGGLRDALEAAFGQV